MPFGLTNAPGTFQSYIGECLMPYLDDFAGTYRGDILIYSGNSEEHDKHAKLVLHRLREFGLHCKAEKCEFTVPRVSILGYVISAAGIEIEPERMQSIDESPIPKAGHDVQVFLGFVNFYRRFIRDYVKISAPITDLLKTGAAIGGSTKLKPFEWTLAAE